MAEPFIGEIKMFGGNFAIRGWAFCQGQLMPIAQNDALYALIRTIYGGDGQTTFALPDLQSRIPLGQGQGPGLSNRTIGEKAGAESVVLAVGEMPIHTHGVACNTGGGTSATPAGNFWAANANTGLPQYAAAPNAAMNATPVAIAGNNLPHDNLMPYLGIHFIIALEGIYPSQN